MTNPAREASVEERLYYRELYVELGMVCRLLLKLSDDAGDMSIRTGDPACERAAKLCDRVTAFETELRAERAVFQKLSEGRLLTDMEAK